MSRWFVYILRCSDGTFYTGSTSDPYRRLSQHEQGTGAKYTRGRSPLEMIYCQPCESKSDALKKEYAIKQLSRPEKEALIQSLEIPIITSPDV